MNMELEKAVIFDTETTDLVDAALVEAAYARCVVADGVVFTAEPFCQRYNPGKPISSGAMAVSHIMDEDVAHCPPASEFALPEDVTYLIGHNVDFDWGVIGKPGILRICTKVLAAELWPGVSHSLSAMMYLLERDRARELTRDSHSATVDIRNCAILLQHIVRQTGAGSIHELWRLSEEARIPKVFSFGKHKGERIDSVPLSYIEWLMEQPDVDPYLMAALRRARDDITGTFAIPF